MAMQPHHKISDGFSGSKVVVAASTNIEFSGDGRVNGGVAQGAKYTVDSIDEYTGEPGTQTFVVKLGAEHGNQSIEIVMRSPHKLPAGGSLNVAFVLGRLGVTDLGVVSPMGVGDGQRYLLHSLSQRGIEHLVIRADGGTARTVTVRNPETGQSTLFCRKPNYGLSESTADELGRMNPDVLILTSVKEADLPLVEALYKNHGRDHRRRQDGSVQRVNAFVPHMGLLKASYPGSVDKLRELLSNTSLLQLNELEAGALLGERFAPGREHMNRLAASGATVTVVTLGERGSITLADDGTYAEQPSYPVRVVDTSGAGDTHLATLMYCHVLRRPRLPLAHSLRVAAWVASQKVAQVGPWSGIPAREVVERFILDHC